MGERGDSSSVPDHRKLLESGILSLVVPQASSWPGVALKPPRQGRGGILFFPVPRATEEDQDPRVPQPQGQVNVSGREGQEAGDRPVNPPE